MITLEHPRNGQAGEPTVTDSFKVKGGLAVKALKTGDKVVFTAAQVGGVWTVTRFKSSRAPKTALDCGESVTPCKSFVFSHYRDGTNLTRETLPMIRVFVIGP